MDGIQWKNRKPKICVPVIEKTDNAILEAMERVRNSCADMVEWRMDFYEKIDDLNQVSHLLQKIHSIWKEGLCLATFRTKEEGGQKEISLEAYIRLYTTLCQSGCVDLIDLEYEFCHGDIENLLSIAHDHRVSVICSFHDFTRTPSLQEMQKRLEAMKQTHADLLKMAVMPVTLQDVWHLLEVTSSFHETHPDVPLITMSMGKKGILSRITGSYSGSAVTFGTMGKSSAPGQIEVHTLKKALDTLDELSVNSFPKETFDQ